MGIIKRADPRLDLALYPVPEAARLARLPVRTLWNWVRGDGYRAGGRAARAHPVIRPTAKSPDGFALSFINLMETVALAGFRESGVSMQRVRKALQYAARHMQMEHPLVHERILSDGVDLFWQYQQREPQGEVHLVNISRGGQKAFPESVMRYLREMEWGPDFLVSRWWPGSRRAGAGAVVVDPARAFGAPVIAKTGIRTRDVFQRFSAGEPIEELAIDYGLSVAQIEAAIRTEARLLEPLAA